VTKIALPDPILRRRPSEAVDITALERDLAQEVDAEVRFDSGSRAAYSTDASNYRQVPIGVVIPRTVDAGAAVVEICRRHRAPLLSRGGGTSLAGECTNAAVVIDWSKYCRRLVSVDVDRSTCIVEPGIVLDHLNAQLRPYGVEFGPRPATHSHCTLGGMIGNNSCGSTAQRTGKVVDNVERLEVVLYDGTRMWVGETSEEEYERILGAGGRPAELYAALRALRDEYATEIRNRYPDIPRRVSGYNLDSLLPEKHFHVAQAIVGSEGTLATVLHAELKLVPQVKAHTLVLLGYPDIAGAADAVPTVVRTGPIALEALDEKLVGFQREKHLNPHALDLLPDGGAWLLVQMGGETQAEADRDADGLLSTVGRGRDDPSVAFFDDPTHERELWEVRESGLGATAHVPGEDLTWPGWEDSAVGPDRLGDYLRELQSLFDEFGYSEASLYGHFGQGCVHCRIPFDLFTAAGIKQFRAFLERAADLVASYGGSLSGEHGDGQARAELLTRMFGPQIVRAFGRFKAIFDPDDRMNPGKIVEPFALDENLRIGSDYDHKVESTYFSYAADDGSFSKAVLRCVGVGKCRREGGGVMCPSYMVTREEEHSTRGRARLLYEMLDGGARGGAITDGWRSAAVHDALDLCLACKGCKNDCPVNVDMATYKAEFLAHHYERRLRPRSHYSMGWLPVWAALAGVAPGAVNRLAHTRGIDTLAKKAAGVDPRRTIPHFAPQSFQQWFRARPAPPRGARGDVMVWPDTFTNRFHPSIARAAVEVLEDAGWNVQVPREKVCCGLTWISTGQLKTARKVLARSVGILRTHVRAGGLVVGLEPSCTAVFRSDAPELIADDPDVRRLQQQTVTFAELLNDRTPGWSPPRLATPAVAQTHCHQHAVMGFEHDTALLEAMGVDLTVLDSGCCGLAGNFGFEQGHYEVSEACAERVLMPAVRAAPPDAVVLADGFSCRTQIEQSDNAGRRAMHLAELVDAARRGLPIGDHPERAWDVASRHSS
jgi:FAD/FMN-containing dehydrogenase/Fe-S oxidoreductase